jgi:hypothetical protein
MSDVTSCQIRVRESSAENAGSSCDRILLAIHSQRVTARQQEHLLDLPSSVSCTRRPARCAWETPIGARSGRVPVRRELSKTGCGVATTVVEYLSSDATVGGAAG